MAGKKIPPIALKKLKSIIEKYQPALENCPDFSDEAIEETWAKIPSDELGPHPTSGRGRPIRHIFYHPEQHPKVIEELEEEFEKKIFSCLLTYFVKTKEDSSPSSTEEKIKSDDKLIKDANEPEVVVSNSLSKKSPDEVIENLDHTAGEDFPNQGDSLSQEAEVKPTQTQWPEEFAADINRVIDDEENSKPSPIYPENDTSGLQPEISGAPDPGTTQPYSDMIEPPTVETEPYLLKNGKVGQKYCEILDYSKICPSREIHDLTIDGLDQIGLELDKGKREIKGVPKKAGDPGENFEFVLTLRYEPIRGPKGKRELSIKILPDPKSLWKEIEPAEELGDRKDHTYSDFKEIGMDKNGKPRFIVTASKRGRAHAHKGTFRDDHTKIEYLKDTGWSIITVADGAGSAKLSRVGSKIACETAVSFITEKLNEHKDELEGKILTIKNSNDSNSADHGLKVLLYDIVANAGHKARKIIKAEKEKRQEGINQFHTTLVIGIYKVFDFGNFFAGFWIGDGALALYDKGAKKLELLGLPDAGEYSGQTRFLTEQRNWTEEANPFARVRYSICDDFTAFFAMSDGITDPKFPTESNLGEIKFWDNLWKDLEDEVIKSDNDVEQNLLKWLDFWAEGEHDDRTIAILY